MCDIQPQLWADTANSQKEKQCFGSSRFWSRRLTSQGTNSVVRVWPWRRCWGSMRLQAGPFWFTPFPGEPEMVPNSHQILFWFCLGSDFSRCSRWPSPPSTLRSFQAGQVSLGRPWRGLSPALSYAGPGLASLGLTGPVLRRGWDVLEGI